MFCTGQDLTPNFLFYGIHVYGVFGAECFLIDFLTMMPAYDNEYWIVKNDTQTGWESF